MVSRCRKRVFPQVLHAALLDGVHLAGAVADDEGRAVVGLGLVDGLGGS